MQLLTIVNLQLLTKHRIYAIADQPGIVIANYYDCGVTRVAML